MNEVNCTSTLKFAVQLAPLIAPYVAHVNAAFYCRVAFHVLAWRNLPMTRDTCPAAPNDGRWNMANLSVQLPTHV